MEPNQPLSLDYLDQIAPKKTRPPLPKGLSIGLIIFGGLVLLIGLSILVMNTTRTSPPNEYIIQRSTTIYEVSKDAQKELRGLDIRGANSTLTAVAGDTVAKVGKANTGKKNKAKAAVEERDNLDELLKTLEEARLNATYDRVYAREMTYQVDTLMSSVKSEYSKTSNSDKKTELETIYDALKASNDQFIKYLSEG